MMTLRSLATAYVAKHDWPAAGHSPPVAALGAPLTSLALLFGPPPSHQQPAVEPFNPPALPRTERIVKEILTLPISAGHTEDEVDEVVATVHEFFRAR